jgi:hypothetical protein
MKPNPYQKFLEVFFDQVPAVLGDINALHDALKEIEFQNMKNKRLLSFKKQVLELAIKQGVKNPEAYAFVVIKNIRDGLPSPYWDNFEKGLPLIESPSQDWEIAPGIPYPAFEEERIQYYLHKGETIEQATMKARADLRNPVLGKDLWDGFLRKCDRLADEALKAQKLGVRNPYLPPSFNDKPAIDKTTVMAKLAMINQNLLES